MNEELNILLKYPLINANIIDGNKNYFGILHINGTDIKVSIKEIPFEESCNKYELECFENISNLDEIKKQKSIVDYLDNLVKILRGTKTIPKNNSNSYRRILAEYMEFTKFHELSLVKSKLSNDLTRVSLSTLDENGRQHDLEISVEDNEFVVEDIDLPKTVQLVQKFTNISDLYSNFKTLLDNLQEFFYITEILDKNCYILDPEKPTRKDCHRRIFLGNNLSVILTMNPLNPRNLPDIKFLGSKTEIEEYRKKLNKNMESWDSSKEFFDSILDILELESFPEKPSVQEDNQAVLAEIGECCICFSLRCENKLPEIICNNESCNQHFHTKCLYEWLTSVKAKRIFNKVFGNCPNCEKPISCLVTDPSHPNS